MEPILEKFDTPVWGDYDIAVVGGGIAGVCAAVAAKRAGADRVLLIEKTIQLGGLATQGLVSLFEPLCDAHGHKITYGMASELMQLCRRYGPDELPAVWEDDPDYVPNCNVKYRTFFSPAVFALALDAFVTEAGVDILFDTLVVKPVMEGNVVTALIVENISGRGAYSVGAVIDATGDADVLSKAGVPCVDGKNYMTYFSHKTDWATLQKANESGNILHARKWLQLGSGPQGDGQPEGLPLVTGTTAEEVTEFVLYGRKMLLDTLRDNKRFDRDISALPTLPQLREIRHIDGEYTVNQKDRNMRMHDSVGVVSDYENLGDWYEMPYRSLYHSEYPNIWAAGRITAASGWAWSILRVIPGCACSGQAAGTAAALAMQRGDSAGTLPYAVLMEKLSAAGVRAHVNETR